MSDSSIKLLRYHHPLQSKLSGLAYCLCTLTLFSGCASVITGPNQTVSIITRDSGKPVEGAVCELTNDKGKWLVSSPGSASIQRSTHDLVVRCELNGFETGLTILKPAAGMVWGNVLAGGLVGYAIDSGQGAGYDYPAFVTIDLVRFMDTQTPSSRSP